MTMQDSYKEDAITEYIKSIDFKKDYSVTKIQEKLKSIIGENPAVKLEWTAENIINELNGNKEGRIEKLLSIKVFYSNSAGEINKVELFI